MVIVAVIAIDTNILVYAHREDSEWHDVAVLQLENLVAKRLRWAIPWPCLHEFLGIVTHPKIYNPPSTITQAFDQVEAWLQVPNVSVPGETTVHLGLLRELCTDGKTIGPRIHDARIAAICLQHGVSELWTADRDFSRYPKLKTRNPLITSK